MLGQVYSTLTIPAIVVAAAAGRGAAVAIATAATSPATGIVGSKAAPSITPATAVVLAPFAARPLTAARQKPVATASVCGVRASVVMALGWRFVFAEHCSVKKEVTELVVVDAAAQASVERPENPLFLRFRVFFFFCVFKGKLVRGRCRDARRPRVLENHTCSKR